MTKFKLNSAVSQRAVNEDLFDKIIILSKEKNLPVNDISEIVNSHTVFDNERQTSPYYRLSGTLNPLFSNVLFNTTGPDSFEYFMTNTLFRDRSYPPNAVDLDEEEDLTYKEALSNELVEVNGWYGYYDPDISKQSNCLFYDMEPKRERFSLIPTGSTKNWDLTVTYPSRSLVPTGSIVDGGLLIVDMKPVIINGRNMVSFGVPVKHGLSFGGIVRLTGLSNVSLNGDYTITRLGLGDGDLIDYYFCVDLDPTQFSYNTNMRMKRVFAGQESEYYFRMFKKVKTRATLLMEDDDYEIYPLAFSKNIYEDRMNQFVINEDIDISGLVDNLNRPLSELYITFIKKDSNNMFTGVKSGVDMPYISNISINPTISDIRRITNASNSHNPLETNITILNNEFFGDVVEYNKYEVIEHVLGEVNHRFNTFNREFGGTIVDPAGIEPNINVGVRKEGYIYKPHHKVQIRAFSAYIEQGDASVSDIPDYASDLGDGRFLWRDLLDIGFSDDKDNLLDYPFLNGCHYLYTNIVFPLKRQDPFGLYGLYYKLFPKDGLGADVLYNISVKNISDDC